MFKTCTAVETTFLQDDWHLWIASLKKSSKRRFVSSVITRKFRIKELHAWSFPKSKTTTWIFVKCIFDVSKKNRPNDTAATPHQSYSTVILHKIAFLSKVDHFQWLMIFLIAHHKKFSTCCYILPISIQTLWQLLWEAWIPGHKI